MRLPFTLGDSKVEDDARIKFCFTSPELHQNIEISLDGAETSVEALVDAFQRFLGALGVALPENVILGFVNIGDDDDDDDDDHDDDDDDDEGDDDLGSNKKT
jgi:hypothetical protein